MVAKIFLQILATIGIEKLLSARDRMAAAAGLAVAVHDGHRRRSDNTFADILATQS